MNILIATIPLIGHVNPLLPLARELVSRGHTVTWYTSRAFEARVRATGAHFTPFQKAPDHGLTPMEDIFPARRNLTGLKAIDFDLRHFFGDPIPDYVDDLRTLNRQVNADVLITDAAFAAGYALKKLLGLRWVAVGIFPLSATSVDTAPFGPGLPPRSDTLGRLRNRLLNRIVQRGLLGGAQKYLMGILERLGLDHTDHFVMDIAFQEADLFLHGSVPAFEYPRSDLPANVRFVGPLLPDPAVNFTLPAWWPELKETRRVVHVTQGTVDVDLNKLLIPTLRALADEDVLVIATTGGRPVSDVPGPLPANVRLEPFIPHDLLLPHVDVMVTNGGFGGVQRALMDGVPLVVSGNTEDKPEVGRRVSWSGVGIDLRTGNPSPERIRQAVLKVLARPTFAARATVMQREYRSGSAPRLATDHIEALTGLSVTRTLARAD